MLRLAATVQGISTAKSNCVCSAFGPRQRHTEESTQTILMLERDWCKRGSPSIVECQSKRCRRVTQAHDSCQKGDATQRVEISQHADDDLGSTEHTNPNADADGCAARWWIQIVNCNQGMHDAVSASAITITAPEDLTCDWSRVRHDAPLSFRLIVCHLLCIPGCHIRSYP